MGRALLWFRVFNPVLQGQKCGPEGAFVKRFLPEFASLDARTIHEPWKAGRSLDYPAPAVDHAATRARFLQLAKDHLKAPA